MRRNTLAGLHRRTLLDPLALVRNLSLLAALLGVGLSGCSDSNLDSDPESDEPDDKASIEAPTNSAIMLAGQVYTPDEYLTYVGVFPKVPTGNVSFEKFREFGNANASTFGGYVFVEEDGRVKRFSVDEDLQLVDGPEFSWQDFGIASANASYTVFVSVERAYTFAPELDVIVVWSPEDMELIDSIELDFPERPADMETWASDGHLVGDRVVWNVFSGSFESNTVHPAITLVIADANDSDAPVEIVEDDRCLPGGPSRVDEDGDYYVHGEGYFGYFLAYGGVPDARTCILRMKAGETELDPDYLVDYKEVLGSYISEQWIHVTGDQFLANAWDPDLPLPEDPEEFWGNEALRPLLADIGDESAEPYPHLEGKESVDGTTRELDGVSYYQLSDTGYVEGGNTDVVALRPDGIRQQFHLSGGFMLGLERVR